MINIEFSDNLLKARKVKKHKPVKVEKDKSMDVKPKSLLEQDIIEVDNGYKPFESK